MFWWFIENLEKGHSTSATLYQCQMKSQIVFILLFLLSLTVKAQTFTDSNLPIVIITTDNDPNTGQPAEIPDDPKVLATMKIIFRSDGTRNYLSDQNTSAFLNYNGRIGIELRGSSSQSLPKKPYGLTTLKADNVSNNNISILGMPSENDWVLNSLAFDPSMIRDNLSYELVRNLGNYSARGKYCEVIVNGDYKGVYVLMEKLKIDSNRINILKMTAADNALPNVTGGYITKADKTTGGDPVAWIMPSYNGSTDFIHEHPKPSEITNQQNTYIYNQFISFQSKITAKNESIKDGFPSIIDIPSFVDFMILNEITSNVDGYQFSTFFHKDRNGKLRAGPIWDFNLTFGNDLFIWNYDRSHTNVWQFDNGDNTGAKFWKDLYTNTTFKCYLTRRWKEVTATGKPLSYAAITNKVDSMVNLLSEAKVREQTRWNTIGNHTNNITALKSWLQTRINWLNNNLSSYTACANPVLPPLVISKIHYNPFATNGFASDDLEFIEITNNSNTKVELSGFYLRELGVTYQFPVNSIVNENSRVFLASNAGAFEQFYGTAPFGQYTRNLSNKSHKIVLADAFGNVIDVVHYFDSAPWPKEADGGGSYLLLSDLNSDNSLASSWVASDVEISVKTPSFSELVIIHPNPAHSIITIQSNDVSLKSFEIFDLTGRKIIFQSDYNSNTINISSLIPGTYFIKLGFFNGESTIKKLVKL